MSGKKSDMEIPCDSCSKSFGKSSLLRHIGQSKTCKTYYGPRYMEMKAKQVSERNLKYRNSLTDKKRKWLWKKIESGMPIIQI